MRLKYREFYHQIEKEFLALVQIVATIKVFTVRELKNSTKGISKFFETAFKIVDQQKDRVITMVSHELRAPINGILGLLEIIIAQVVYKMVLSYLSHSKSCSKLRLYLVNSTLDLSQLRNNSFKIVDGDFSLSKFLDEVRSLYFPVTTEKQ